MKRAANTESESGKEIEIETKLSDLAGKCCPRRHTQNVPGCIWFVHVNFYWPVLFFHYVQESG